ncbi:MAG: Barrier-to-autointegration factor, partial [Paramarteilia canceri]
KTSTSKKHMNFVSEPLGEKPICEVPGIGPVYGEKLTQGGFDKAYVLLGQYLLLKKDNQTFEEFLMDEYGISKRSAEMCSNGFASYSENNL